MLKFRGILLIMATLGTTSFALVRNIVPVFILDDGLLDGIVRTQTYPFHMTKVEEFEAILGVAQKRSYSLIFFIEDDFAYEYISSKDEKGTPFYHLKQAFLDKRVKLLPRVIDPYIYLKDRFTPFDFNMFHVRRTTTKLRFQDKYMYIFFKDGTNETRTEKLRRHDAIIQEVTFAARQISKDPVVAFYTGKRNPLDVEEEDGVRQGSFYQYNHERSTLVVQCGTASFYLVHPLILYGHYEMTIDKLKVIKCDYGTLRNGGWSYNIELEDLGVESKLNSPYYEMIFYFNYLDPMSHNKGWRLNELEFRSPERSLRTVKICNATIGEWDKFHNISYRHVWYIGHDYDNGTYRNGTSVLLEAIGIFHFVVKVYPSKLQLHEDVSVPAHLANERFVSIVLLNCLSIAFILAVILLYSVQMLMGIKTNSIYDSPDQPPLFTSDITE